MSKEEELFARKMDEIFERFNVIKNWRPNALKNEKTGKNLEIDYYVGKYSTGFEYQGGIHFRDVRKYGGNSDNSREHDLMKYELLTKKQKRRKKPLTLIEIFPTDLKGDFKKNLIMRVKNNIEFYKKRNGIYNSINLSHLLCFLEIGIKYKKENIELGLIPEQYIQQEKDLLRLLNPDTDKRLFTL